MFHSVTVNVRISFNSVTDLPKVLLYDTRYDSSCFLATLVYIDNH